MAKKSKKIKEIKAMFKDIDIDFNEIDENAINDFIGFIKKLRNKSIKKFYLKTLYTHISNLFLSFKYEVGIN